MATAKPPVVLLHGAFCGGWAMQDWQKAMGAAGYETHAPDLRHHQPHVVKRDLKALGITSVADFTQDLHQFIMGFSEKPILVGHSMGGLLAQMLAARGHAAAIILLAPSAPWGVLPSSWQEVASAFGVTLAGRFWERALFPTYEIAAEHALDNLQEKDRRRIFSQFVPESGRAVFEILHWPLDLARATTVMPHSVECPVFCASGGRDIVNPAETVRRVAGRYRGRTTYRNYSGMSHWLVSEPGWDEIAADALVWLERVHEPA